MLVTCLHDDYIMLDHPLQVPIAALHTQVFGLLTFDENAPFLYTLRDVYSLRDAISNVNRDWYRF